MRQVRQEVDSEARGLKVQEGESSSSSQQFLPSRIEGLKKTREAHDDKWIRIKTKEWKEGRICLLDESV